MTTATRDSRSAPPVGVPGGAGTAIGTPLVAGSKPRKRAFSEHHTCSMKFGPPATVDRCCSGVASCFCSSEWCSEWWCSAVSPVFGRPRTRRCGGHERGRFGWHVSTSSACGSPIATRRMGSAAIGRQCRRLCSSPIRMAATRRIGRSFVPCGSRGDIGEIEPPLDRVGRVRGTVAHRGRGTGDRCRQGAVMPRRPRSVDRERDRART